MANEQDTERAYLKEHGAIRLYDWRIDQSTSQRFESLLGFARKEKIQKIRLEIACPGGNVSHSLRIADMVAAYDGEITGIVEPYAFSGAAIILQACHKRLAIEHSMLQFHSSRNGAISGGTDQRAFDDQRDFWLRNNDRFITLCANRSGKPRDVIKKLFDWDTVITAEMALKYHLIDAIVPRSAHTKHTKKKPHTIVLETYEIRKLSETFRQISEARSSGEPVHLIVNITLEGPDGMLYTHLLTSFVRYFPYPVSTHGPNHILEHELGLFLLGSRRSCNWISDIMFGPLEIITSFRELENDELSGIKFQALADMERCRAAIVRAQLSNIDMKMLVQQKRFTAEQARAMGIVHEVQSPKHFKNKSKGKH